MMESNFPEFPRLFRSGRGKTLFAGFSGGADSTALLLLLAQQARTDGFLLQAIHFEHGLRGEASRADAAWCETFCRQRGIPCTVIPLALNEKIASGVNVEAAAREARLIHWQRLVAAAPGSAVALAHHADDAAENLLIRLCRGSSSSGLYALRPQRTVAGVTFLRPLLHWRRSEIERFLLEIGVSDWRTDATNADNAMLRNDLRNRLLPELYRHFPPARAGLQQSLAALADDAEALESMAEERARELPQSERYVAFWQTLPPALRNRVLMIFLARHGIKVPPSVALFRRFAELVAPTENGERRELPLDAEHRLCVQRGELGWGSGAAAEPAESMAWNWRRDPEIWWRNWRLTAAVCRAEAIPAASPWCARFDAAIFPETLTLRRRTPGDTLQELGNPVPRRVKHLLVNAKLTGDSEPPMVTVADGTICWIPGVRRSDFAPLRSADVPAVVLTASLAR